MATVTTICEPVISLALPFAPTVAASSFCHDWIESEAIPSSGSVRESWFLARLFKPGLARLFDSNSVQVFWIGSLRFCSQASALLLHAVAAHAAKATCADESEDSAARAPSGAVVVR
jgi:hypothetical protein